MSLTTRTRGVYDMEYSIYTHRSRHVYCDFRVLPIRAVYEVSTCRQQHVSLVYISYNTPRIHLVHDMSTISSSVNHTRVVHMSCTTRVRHVYQKIHTSYTTRVPSTFGCEIDVSYTPRLRHVNTSFTPRTRGFAYPSFQMLQVT